MSLRRSTLISTVSFKAGEMISASGGKIAVLLSKMDKKHSIVVFRDDDLQEKPGKILWSETIPKERTSWQRITALLPLDLDHVLVGYGKHLPRYARLRQCLNRFILTDHAELDNSSTHDLMTTKGVPARVKGHKNDFAILSLFEIANARTGQKLIVGGGDDGSISFWDSWYAKLAGYDEVACSRALVQ